MSDNDAIARLYDKIESQSDKIDQAGSKTEKLAEAVAGLAQVIAAKEVNDHHVSESIREIKEDARAAKTEFRDYEKAVKEDKEKLEKRVAACEKINEGDNAMRKLFWILLTLFVTGVFGAVIKLVLR